MRPAARRRSAYRHRGEAPHLERDEEKWVPIFVNLLGMCDDVLLHVTYTERDERIWFISARRAERQEQDLYFSANSV